MKHKTWCMLLLAPPIVACLSCAGTPLDAPLDNPLLGQWTGKSGSQDVTITLHPGGTCDGVEPGVTRLGRWTQKGSKVILAFDADAYYGGLISRREMLVTKESSRQTITLVRTGKRRSERE